MKQKIKIKQIPIKYKHIKHQKYTENLVIFYGCPDLLNVF